MRLQKLESAKDPESAAAIILVQCAKCKGFSQWNDAVASGWKRDLEGCVWTVYLCGVCLHDIIASDNLQKVSYRI